MRILITTDTIGGVWTFTRELVAGLLEAGCEIILVSFGRSPSEPQRQWTSEMRWRWRRHFRSAVYDAPIEWMQHNEDAYTRPAKSLMQLIEECRVDLLHSNQFCFGALPIDVPKVVTAHSDVLSWARACREDTLDDSVWLRRYCSLVSTGLAGAQAVVAPTHWMLRALGESYDLPEDQRIIANGRSIPSSPQPFRKLQAITAGRLWDEAKGIYLLSEVSSPIPLLVAGDAAFDGVTAASVLEKVRMLGPLVENAVLEIFRESELYICTSRYEPFGLAPLEAALCGCAILAHDIPSLREVWKDGALYFTDATSLSELLYKLHSDRELLAKAKACSSVQAQIYSREKMTSAYLALFRQVLARHKEVAHVA
jgi:glycogen synthase